MFRAAVTARIRRSTVCDGKLVACATSALLSLRGFGPNRTFPLNYTWCASVDGALQPKMAGTSCT